MKRIPTQRLASALILALGTCGFAQADTTYTYTYAYDWTVPGTGINDCSTGAWLNSCTLSGGSRSLVSATPGAPADANLPPSTITNTATGWSNTGGDVRTLGNNQTLEQGQVQAWSGTGGNGLGIRNLDYQTGEDGSNTTTGYDYLEGSSPEHAVDNNQRYDSMLYTFSSSVALSNVKISYSSSDSDIIVLAYTGSDPWSLANKLAGQTYANLINLGWQLIGNYKNLITGSTGNAVNADGISSSYWLVGAANTLISGGTNETSGSYKYDYVKLAGLGGTVTTQTTPPPPPGVPEPGSLALLGLGVLLLARARARS